MIRFGLALVLAALLGLAERILLPFLPGWLSIRPLLPLIVILWMGGRRSPAWVAAVVGGLGYDAYAVSSPDLAVLRLPLIILVLDAVQRHWLTNRSLIASLGLMVLARLLDLGSAWLVPSVAYWVGLAPYAAAGQPHVFVVFLGDLLLIAAAFVLGAGLKRRFVGTVNPDR